MTQLTPISSRKRPSPDDGAQSDGFSTCDTGSTKRQRTLSPSTTASSGLRLSIPHEDAPPTPPASARVRGTMALRLVIPQEQISREQQKKLSRHRADAERWKPKLQRPYPRTTEIEKAYPFKLMRHYPDATTRIQPNFVRPSIDKSPRVSRLLEQFPLIDTAQSAREAHVELQTNIHITETEHAQRLAWQSFSRTERDRVDRGREAMIQSGLFTDDLRLETVGRQNRLPEWKKPWTGRFARERQAAG
ncbi:hypothetical protein BU25DRAFT_464851 [Macroventuria anomochaeta]|uniref:Uncharacterized protein n=1 Tax=Macroventuria anomochaeta TaxID=301207 RepID=A0ACB6SHM0_9PLEO|nr:uncharacterized protein BU25DRAFT_464851 [Macroventuria anomochaeta]KAF2633671.1 hypothetical protein BU25DRAFT_464851 [Macroventuria anomochaeta]